MREPFSAFIEAISEEFASLRLLVERAAAQVSDEQFFANLDNEANSLHNVQFYLDTMEAIREAISFGRFEGFRQDFHRSCDRLALDT